MNIKQFSLALLASALPLSAIGQSHVKFSQQDFKAAESVDQNGQTVLKVKLSKSGKAKLKKLQKDDVFLTDLGGVDKSFEVKAPLKHEQLQIGPYTKSEAKRAVESLE